MRVVRPVLQLLAYWRSYDPSIYTWGWIAGVIFVVPLVFLGLWGIPIVVILLVAYGYVLSVDELPRALWRAVSGEKA